MTACLPASTDTHRRSVGGGASPRLRSACHVPCQSVGGKYGNGMHAVSMKRLDTPPLSLRQPRGYCRRCCCWCGLLPLSRARGTGAQLSGREVRFCFVVVSLCTSDIGQRYCLRLGAVVPFMPAVGEKVVHSCQGNRSIGCERRTTAPGRFVFFMTHAHMPTHRTVPLFSVSLIYALARAWKRAASC